MSDVQSESKLSSKLAPPSLRCPAKKAKATSSKADKSFSFPPRKTSIKVRNNAMNSF